MDIDVEYEFGKTLHEVMKDNWRLFASDELRCKACDGVIGSVCNATFSSEKSIDAIGAAIGVAMDDALDHGVNCPNTSKCSICGHFDESQRVIHAELHAALVKLRNTESN
jgi:hypothetical protein